MCRSAGALSSLTLDPKNLSLDRQKVYTNGAYNEERARDTASAVF
jgi:hypothetical protein